MFPMNELLHNWNRRRPNPSSSLIKHIFIWSVQKLMNFVTGSVMYEKHTALDKFHKITFLSCWLGTAK